MDTINYRIKLLVDEFSKGNNTKFAKELNTTETTIRNYCNGKSLPKFDILFEIVQRFNINPSWIILGEEPMLKNEVLSLPSIKKIEKLQDENTFLKKEVELKDEIIALLKKQQS